MVGRIDWECDVVHDWSDQNLGLNRRMISAINWVFREFDSAIVLEDDCVPHPRFFDFCSSMLHRYRDDSRVVHVSGECYRVRREGNCSYFFSKYPLAWGWGTWRRAWSLFDPVMRSWPQFRAQPEANALFDSADERHYWLSTFDRLYQDQTIGKADLVGLRVVLRVHDQRAVNPSRRRICLEHRAGPLASTHTTT